MDISIIPKGLVIGSPMAITIGPIGIMCVRTTIAEGRMRRLIRGLAAATADMHYCCVPASGLTVISATLLNERIWIRLIGSVLLFSLGIKTIRNRPPDPHKPVRNDGMLRSYLMAVFLTFTNPLTVLALLAVFVALGPGNGLGYLSAYALVSGVFIGSALLFVVLSSGVTAFRKRFDIVVVQWVNRIASVLIIISGFIAVVTFV